MKLKQSLLKILMIFVLFCLSIASTSAQQGNNLIFLPLIVQRNIPQTQSTATPTITPTMTVAFLPTGVGIPINTPTSTPTPTATPTPQLPNPSFDGCQEDPNPLVAPNYPVRIVNVDKKEETVTLQNISSVAIDLTGWHMCSITGNQEHRDIAGLIQPNMTLIFVHNGGPIWRNDQPDDGALYNASGQLISYWDDPEP